MQLMVWDSYFFFMAKQPLTGLLEPRRILKLFSHCYVTLDARTIL